MPLSPPCACEPDAPKDLCWCVDRSIEVGPGRLVSPTRRQSVVSEVHDARTVVWMVERVHDPALETTADPEWPLVPFDLSDVQRPEVVGLPAVRNAPGWPDWSTLNECRVVRADGVEVVADANERYPWSPFTPYELEYTACLAGDGGPPLVPFRATALGDSTAFDLVGMNLGRGWALDAAQDPPRIVTALGVEDFLLEEASGWMRIRATASGLERELVAPAGAEPPLLLPDGAVWTPDGTWHTPSGATSSLTLGSLADVRVDGPWIVEESPTLLRIVDRRPSPPSLLLEEVGPRTATLLAIAEDGSRLLESEPDGIRTRRLADGAVHDLGSASVGVRRAALSDAGDVAVIALQTSATSVQQTEVTAWDLSLPLPEPRVLCSDCASVMATDPASGAVLAGRTGTVGLSVYTPIGTPGSPDWDFDETPVVEGFVAEILATPGVIDPFGWAWVGQSGQLTGIDLAGATAAPPIALDADEARGVDGPTWLLSGGDWHQLTGLGTWTRHHAIRGDAAIALYNDRGAGLPVGGEGLMVGRFVEGERLLDQPLPATTGFFQPRLPDTVHDPAFVGAPCLPYRLGEQPAFVYDSPLWACAR